MTPTEMREPAAPTAPGPAVPPGVVPFSVEPTAIDGLMLIGLKQVGDERGTVREFFRTSGFAESGLRVDGSWQQINVTETRRGALRGIHAEAMNKLVGVVSGSAFGAYVDLRSGSPTLGRVVTVELRAGVQVLVPAGVGNGFQSTGDGVSQYVYAFDDEWRPGMPGAAVTPLDPALAIAWPITVDPADRTQISAKDVAAPTLADLVAAGAGE